MTVPVNSRRRDHQGNGVALQFAAPMAYQKTHLAVYLIEEVDGVEVPTLVSPSAYTVVRFGVVAGSIVTFIAAPTSLQKILILRVVPFAQEVDVTNLGRFLPEMFERAYDLLSMQAQQLNDDVSRSLRLPILSTASAELPDVVPFAPLVGSADGSSIEFGDATLTGDMLLRPALENDETGLGLLFNNTVTGAAINQLRTGQHFVQNGARIHRLNDRLFLNAATQNDGAFPNVGRCWMDNEWVAGGFGTGPGASALMYIANDTSPSNAIGLISAVQSKDFTSVGTTPIGGFSCVFNNHATLATKGYAHYIEIHRSGAAADSYGLEVDTRTLTATLQPTPRQLGDVSCLQLASGAEWSATGQFDASCAIQMAPNPKKFKVGINVMHDALVDIGGGVTEFAGLPRYSLISWFDDTGARSGWITSSASTAATGATIEMRDNQVNIAGTSGVLRFAFVSATNAVNRLEFYSSIATNPVRVLAGGTDTNIDLSLEPKGAGQVVIPIAQVRNAADDTAAAALSPPVPVGGIYRNGSVLMIRTV